MTERLVNQFVVDSTECFYPNKKFSLKRGRKPLITSDKWLDAVKKIHSMKDNEIAKELGVSRQTVWRFRNNPKNIDVINEGIEFLKRLSETYYYRDLDNWDVFKNVYIVKEWKNLMENRRLKRKTINGWLKGLWHICKLLKRHPAKLTIMEASKINKKIRESYYNGDLDQIPRGLNYQSCRESIRGFFMSVHNVSAQYLTNMGITKENLPSFGKYSKMNIPREVRHRFEETIKKYCDNENEYWDTLNFCVMAYATATRATALSEVELNHAIIFNEKEWVFEIVDKGNIKWNKIMVGHLLES